jgi:hypothetical protein
MMSLLEAISPTARQLLNQNKPMTLTEIQKLAARLSAVRAELQAVIDRLQLKQNAAMTDAMPDIRRCVGSAAEKHAAIICAVDGNRSLFERPKSQIVEGIKFGLRKGAGGISWEDDDQVVNLIDKNFTKPEAALLIKTTRKPIKSAINDLDVSDLKKIGCTIEDTGNVAFAKPVDTAVDKIVNALLKNAIADKIQEAA